MLLLLWQHPLTLHVSGEVVDVIDYQQQTIKSLLAKGGSSQSEGKRPWGSRGNHTHHVG